MWKLAAAKAEKEISAMAEIGEIPERHLRPLTHLLPELQRQASLHAGGRDDFSPTVGEKSVFISSCVGA